MANKEDETSGRKEPFWGIGQLVLHFFEFLESELNYLGSKAWAFLILLLISLIFIIFSAISFLIGFFYGIWGLYLLFSAGIGKIGGAFLCGAFLMLLSGFFLWIIRKIAHKILN
jgi:hypothetical protein